MGKHSGRHAFKTKLKELGFDLGENAMEDAFRRFKELADKKKDVFDEDIVALVDDSFVRSNEHIRFVALQVIAGSKGPQKADLDLEIDVATFARRQVVGQQPEIAVRDGEPAENTHDFGRVVREITRAALLADHGRHHGGERQIEEPVDRRAAERSQRQQQDQPDHDVDPRNPGRAFDVELNRMPGHATTECTTRARGENRPTVAGDAQILRVLGAGPQGFRRAPGLSPPATPNRPWHAARNAIQSVGSR